MTAQPWDIRVTLDLFFGGLGIGVFLLSTALSFYDKDRYERLIKLGAFLSPALVGLGLLLLISELGRPERFLSTIYNFNAASVTSWGTLFQSAFMALAALYAYCQYKGDSTSPLAKNVQIVGSVLAIFVGVYHGLLLASLGRPLWSGGMVSVLFLISSLLGGVSVMLMIKGLAPAVSSSTTARSQTAATVESGVGSFNFTYLFFILVTLQLVLTVVWQITLYRSGAETAAAAGVMMSEYGTLWSFGVIGIGLVLPFVGSALQLFKDRNANMSQGFALALSIFVLIGTFALKHIILSAGQINLPFFS